ncbi:nitroreductase family protein [Paenibacillus eucommiae]|uniref:Putative NAD(P)H nitroreductase n=1 Tax=Paenibacillus eucommiae TaxID=1355755 RepID=A0ABS4IV11_9BACL|nr:nitroreductase [Paenibacillus eucommiae]MBP1991412.1 nitroreductase [Paenibacillus eucommiae]
MNVKDAILSRRSIGRVKPDAVDPKLIEELLEAAVWAPNHRNTEPWRFIVMTGEGRKVLGRAYGDIAAEEADDKLSEEELQLLYSKQELKALRAPVVIAVAMCHTPGLVVPWIEEIAAVHAAIQNMLLTAHALGLGAIWRTGDPTYHPKMKAAFGFQGEEELAGFIYVGHPEVPAGQGKRSEFQQKTVWLTE